MAFTRVCGLGDVPVDTMDSFFVEDVEVLVVHGSSGVHAFDGICPHEEFPLVDGYFDDSTIVCIGHGWVFDAMTGQAVYPPRLSPHRVSPPDRGQRGLCRRRLGRAGVRIR